MTFKLLKYHLGYGKAQTHAASIDIFGLGNAPKELEELFEVFFWNTNTCILNIRNEPTIIKKYFYWYWAMECEFGGIAK